MTERAPQRPVPEVGRRAGATCVEVDIEIVHTVHAGPH